MFSKKLINILFLVSYSFIVQTINSSSFTITYTVKSHYGKGESLVTVGRFTYGYKLLNIKWAHDNASLFIGQFSSIADNVTIFLGGNHRTDWITTFPFGHINAEVLGGESLVKLLPTTKGDVVIGNDVWIGHGATIMSGVTIGDGAVIGAHSVVAKNVEPFSIVVGNPARHVRFRFDENIRSLLLRLRWWDLEISQIREITSILCSCPNAEMINTLLTQFRNN